jgi:hypothetical protein
MKHLNLIAADSNKVRLVLFVISIAMFILSAGAPDATGGIGMQGFVGPTW